MPGFHGSDTILLLLSLFWIWMFIDCLLNQTLSGGKKLFWMLFILLTHFFGALLYFFIARPRRIARPQYVPPTYVQRQAPYQAQEPYRSYEQGYQVQKEMPPTYQESSQPSVSEQPKYRQYEQPQVMYPQQYDENS
jgi:hypothetical protein